MNIDNPMIRPDNREAPKPLTGHAVLLARINVDIYDSDDITEPSEIDCAMPERVEGWLTHIFKQHGGRFEFVECDVTGYSIDMEDE